MLSEKIISAMTVLKDAVYDEEVLDPKTQSLMALAVSAATGCKPCTQNNYQAARENGATDADISAAIGTAMFGVAGKCKNYATAAIEELKQQ